MDLQLRHVPIIFGNLGVLLQSLELFYIMYKQAKVSKERTTVDGTSLMSPAFMIFGVLFSAVLVQHNSPSSVFENNPCIYIMLFGLMASKATNVLLIAHVTKTEMMYWDNCFLLPIALLLNQFLNCVVDESFLVSICMVFAALDNLKYMAITWREVCDYFQISCFVVPPQEITDNNKREETNGRVVNGGVVNGGVTNGGVKNGEVKNGGVKNGEVKNGGLVKPENVSARIVRRQQAKK